MWRAMTNRSGFTLVEILIVVIILGILAAVAIPQFGDSTDDAREATLNASLAQMRSAIELYYHQHGADYPGEKHHVTGAATTTTAQADSAFIAQLTLYTSLPGVAGTTKDATFKFGPYMKTGLPENPFNGLSTVKCDITTTDLSSITSDATTGWKFYVLTGRFIANDGAHDSN